MNLLSFFDRANQEIEEDELIERLSVEALRQLNEMILMKRITRVKKQAGDEIKTFYQYKGGRGD